MIRLLTPGVAVAALLCLANAAPVPKDPASPGLYFPTQVGATWAYEYVGERKTVSYTVTAVETKPEATLVSVETLEPGGETKPAETVLVSVHGLIEVQDTNQLRDSQIWLLKLPQARFPQWSGHFYLDQKGATQVEAQFESKAESVEVPAGKYDAIRVEAKWMFNQQPVKRTCWYAPMVGLVKQVCLNEEVLVLKSFTPGKP